MVKVAVVGGGLFGITCALLLDEVGCQVDLFEMQPTLMNAASRVNQRRLHMGYHYPRAHTTIEECQVGLQSFMEMYGDAVMAHTQTYYTIANEGSLTSPDDYLKILASHNLPFEVVATPKHLKGDAVGLTITCPEQTFNYGVLKGICLEKLRRSNVRIHLNSFFWSTRIRDYDMVVVATYLYNNFYREGCEQTLQMELVEKPVVVVDEKFKGISTVVGDGEFCCLDYMEEMGVWLLGHVKHAIHYSMTATGAPYMWIDHQWMLNAGVIPTTVIQQRYMQSNFRAMAEGARKFFNIEHITHIGSMFTYRVVLPHKEDTDERPTLVEQVSDKVITVFAGKIPCVVDAARKVVRLLNA